MNINIVLSGGVIFLCSSAFADVQVGFTPGDSAVTFLANQHSKFAVTDGQTVQTGSANYTASAFSRNAENVVVIRNESAVVHAYQQEFERLWSEGEPITARY